MVDIESAFARHRHLFPTEYYCDKAAGVPVTLEKMKDLSRRRFSESAVAGEQRLGGGRTTSQSSIDVADARGAITKTGLGAMSGTHSLNPQLYRKPTDLSIITP